jgi:hypothetical protein
MLATLASWHPAVASARPADGGPNAAAAASRTIRYQDGSDNRNKTDLPLAGQDATEHRGWRATIVLFRHLLLKMAIGYGRRRESP